MSLRNIIIIGIIFLLTIFGLYKISPTNFYFLFRSHVTLIGMLNIDNHCMIPEGCGAKYKLYDSIMRDYTPITGKINASDNNEIIKVDGYWSVLPINEVGSMGGSSHVRAIKVEKYTVLSTIPYDTFLGEKTREHLQKQFGCTCSKSFYGPNNLYSTIACNYHINEKISWEYEKGQPTFNVKVESKDNQVDLFYDGDTGLLIQEKLTPPTAQICR